MRLLERLPSGDFKVVSFNDENPPPYAILSHTWTEGQEVTYNELVAGTGKNKTSYDKLRFCGGRAAADGLHHELSTAINSMFRWYQRASKCYAYLSDVIVPEETLQELLAPPCVEFFSKNGKRLGSRISLEQEIHEITKIATGALRGQSLAEFSVEERMSWAAKRTTTLKEDKVYCLLGIFGVFLSLIYGEGEAYATVRLREEIEKRQEGQRTARLHDLSVLPVLPFPRNELFVGREEQLQSLEQSLLPSNTHRRMTIYGLGGCGKSALALEHIVFWVPAISQESFELAYRELGVRLGVPGITEDNADIRKLVKDALSSGSFGDWLMIVDNADDSGVLLGTADNNAISTRLSDCLPHSSSGSILFTTRSRKVAGDLTPSSVLEVNEMSKAEARQLLARRLTKQALLDDKMAVDKLLAILTYLPLAIVQAAAFINNNDISVSGYISLFRHTGTESELFSERFEDPSRYRDMDSTVAKTWHISFDQIRRQDRLAAAYLSFMACIDRIDIPQSLLPRGGSLVQQVKALGTLAGYAFITERQQTAQELDQERFFNMHRLVHMASAWWLEGHDERATWAGKVVARLEELVPHGGHERKEVWMPYLSHAIYVAGLSDTVEKTARASLLDRVGRCQATLGQYSAAGTTHQRALSLREKSLGKKHIQTLRSMNEVGLAFSNQGIYEAAEAMNRQTLALEETYEAAEAMNRQTLALEETVLGREHPSTLATMSNLALVLDSQGKYEAAEAMNRQTLALKETVLGHEHPETLMSVYCLAHLLANRHHYHESLVLYERACAAYPTVLGNDHPTTRACRQHHSKALASQRQDRYTKSYNAPDSGASTQRAKIRIKGSRFSVR
ncbi:kinesin light chain 1 [Ophiobolus disseminans]|uniref:Kinesin light chain 1 n=1 Tax=Ophiobolus disseminans TaxID=1469910 RepID=A0A6A6ZFT2_9PLEO|nr:kinesin light chain 1 [Ophiobolus disseminans]